MRRSARSLSCTSGVSGRLWSRTHTSPPEIGSSPHKQCMKTVLPEPEAPTIASTSPRRIVRSSPWSTTLFPNDFRDAARRDLDVASELAGGAWIGWWDIALHRSTTGPKFVVGARAGVPVRAGHTGPSVRTAQHSDPPRTCYRRTRASARPRSGSRPTRGQRNQHRTVRERRARLHAPARSPHSRPPRPPFSAAARPADARPRAPHAARPRTAPPSGAGARCRAWAGPAVEPA